MVQLFRLSDTVERDPAIQVWLDRQPREMGSIARRWYLQMRACGDDVREVMHDGCPVVCVQDAPFGYVNIPVCRIATKSGSRSCSTDSNDFALRSLT